MSIETFQLKRISNDAVATAIDKADRYRLLDEPVHAESICLDILAIEPSNQRVLVIYLLSLTDQFNQRLSTAFSEAKAALERIEGDYPRAYFEGIIYERRGIVHHQRATPHAGDLAHEWLSRAMRCYAKAEALRPPGNDDAILRWNTCARIIMRNPEITASDNADEPGLE
jgi:hypothetical protein